MKEVNWEEFEAEHARLIRENVRLKAFHDNIQSLYHDTIGNHETSVSVHKLGDELVKVGELKEIDIIE